ncbi:M48 family metalloprotease [Thiohalorhabdus sp.]|uniref:M48 family metalloprotease n=1 Tax=Thiohalorhabdus sp. TaxID=3094134 RepID=UPI002FC2C9F3
MRYRDPANRIRLQLLALVLAGAVALPLPALAELPSLGSQTGGELTATQEVEIGQRFLAQARQELTFVHDPEVVAFVRLLGNRVAAQTDFDAYPFQFYVVKDSRLNAFAVPGGHIFVHSGLIERSDSVSELAGVLAHEVAHITQRHMARQVAASKRSQASSLLLVAAAVLAGMQGHGEAATGLVAGASAYSQQEMLAYSRSHEREADRLGVKYLAGAGFNPDGLPRFLQKLQSWSQLQGRAPPPYLSTHPLTGERIADAKGRASQLDNGSNAPLGETAFARIKARVQAITADSPEKAFQELQERVRSHPEDQAARYGLAIAAGRSGRSQQALDQARALVADHPETVAYRRTLAELYLAEGQTDAAIDEIKAALERRPGNPDLREALGKTLLAQGKAEQARQTLREVTRDFPERPSGYSALANALSRLDRPVEAHRSEAEARWLQGQRTEALEQLRLAKRLARERDSAQLSQIEARIRELEP